MGAKALLPPLRSWCTWWTARCHVLPMTTKMAAPMHARASLLHEIRRPLFFRGVAALVVAACSLSRTFIASLHRCGGWILSPLNEQLSPLDKIFSPKHMYHKKEEQFKKQFVQT